MAISRAIRKGKDVIKRLSPRKHHDHHHAIIALSATPENIATLKQNSPKTHSSSRTRSMGSLIFSVDPDDQSSIKSLIATRSATSTTQPQSQSQFSLNFISIFDDAGSSETESEDLFDKEDSSSYAVQSFKR